MCSACGHIKLLITITLTFSDMDHETLITYIHDGYIYIYIFTTTWSLRIYADSSKRCALPLVVMAVATTDADFAALRAQPAHVGQVLPRLDRLPQPLALQPPLLLLYLQDLLDPLAPATLLHLCT